MGSDVLRRRVTQLLDQVALGDASGEAESSLDSRSLRAVGSRRKMGVDSNPIPGERRLNSPNLVVEAEVRHYPDGQQAKQLRAGYLILTHGKAWTSRLIRFGQRLRFRGERRAYAHWNHVALALDDRGGIAEALGEGVRETNISKYAGTDYYVLEVECSDEDRRQIVAFADAVVEARFKYGKVLIFSLGLTLLFGSTYTLGKIGTAICSGFAAEAITRMGAIFPRPPAYMMPADVAEFFDVRPALESAG